MKKRIYIFFLFVSTFSYSQEFATPDAEWVYDYIGTGSGITKIYYLKDTIVQSRNLRKFQREMIRGGATLPGLNTFYNPIYFQVEQGTVIVSEDLLHFDTLYKFDAPIGQKWKTYYNYRSNRKDSIESEVIDTFQVEVDNKMIPAQAIEYTYFRQSQPWTDTVYQNIGPKWAYILPWDFLERAVDGGEGGFIRCFKNDELGQIEFSHRWHINPFVFECDQVSTIQNLNLNQLKFYPNPVDSQLKIENEMSNTTFKIFDLTGKKLKSNVLPIGKSEHDLTNLNSGIYFIKIKGQTFKFIKQ